MSDLRERARTELVSSLVYSVASFAFIVMLTAVTSVPVTREVGR